MQARKELERPMQKPWTTDRLDGARPSGPSSFEPSRVQSFVEQNFGILNIIVTQTDGCVLCLMHVITRVALRARALGTLNPQLSTLKTYFCESGHWKSRWRDMV